MFSLDSKFMSAMGRIGDWIGLNLLFLLTSLPIFTIGASATAMYSVCFRLGTDREGKLGKSYFRAFRENFRQATVLWLSLVVLGVAAGAGVGFAYENLGYGYIVFVLLLIVVLMVASYTFPLLSRFQNGNGQTLKNALLLSVGYFPRTAVMVTANVLPFVVFFVSPYTFFRTAIVWVGIYFALAAQLNTLLLGKVFAPYIPEKTE